MQDKILAICKSHLAPQGVGYVSYNTYPGWNMRGTIRDLMCFHAGKVADPRERVGEARKFLDFMAKYLPTKENAYGLLIKTEVERMRRQSDAYLLHDHLEETNSQCYFHEFVRSAWVHELQYLGDADVHTMMLSNMGPEIASVLRQLAGDIIEMEQYMDFMRNRSFRQTLLCHKRVAVSRSMQAESVLDAFVSTRLVPKNAENALGVAGEIQFVTPDERGITSSSRLLTAALIELNADHTRTAPGLGKRDEPARAFPTPLRFGEIYDRACSRSAADSIHCSDQQRHERMTLAADLLRLYAMGLVQISVWAPSCARTVSDRPSTTSITRHQVALSPTATNVYHELVQVADLERQILQLCDGNNCVEAIINELSAQAVAHRLIIRQAGKVLSDLTEAQSVLSHLVPSGLERIVDCGMLLSGQRLEGDARAALPHDSLIVKT